MDNRQIVAADKGPFYAQIQPDWSVGNRGLIDTKDSPRTWRPFNSPNHGGRGNGEGQNCLYPDGSVSFQRTPIVGIDNDNIYTLMTIAWGSREGYNRIHGETVHEAPSWPYPGQNAFGRGPGRYSSTDSLVYP
jgi:hypothetical protein